MSSESSYLTDSEIKCVWSSDEMNTDGASQSALVCIQLKCVTPHKATPRGRRLHTHLRPT